MICLPYTSTDEITNLYQNVVHHVCTHTFPEIHKVACNKHANIDGKTCNNIPEAVKPIWAILVKLGEIRMIPLIILYKAQGFITG